MMNNLSNRKESLRNLFQIFKPTIGYFITPILILINIAIYIAMICTGVHFMEPTSIDLIRWGANLSDLTLDGQWWRLITCNFIHIGILHLLLNMYALAYIGSMIEPMLGKMRFFIAYICSGVISSLFSIAWHSEPIVSAGASGAIFGMYGVFLGLLLTNLIPKEQRKVFLMNIGFFIVLNLAYGTKGNVDNAAHIGGLVSGIIIGFIYYFDLRLNRNNARFIVINSFIMFLTLLTTYGYLRFGKNDYTTYKRIMKEYYSNQALAHNESFTEEKISTDSIISIFQHQNIPLWKSSLKLLEQVEKLDISEDSKINNRALMRYCKLAIRRQELLIKQYEKPDNITYQKDIEETIIAMNGIVAQLEK